MQKLLSIILITGSLHFTESLAITGGERTRMVKELFMEVLTTIALMGTGSEDPEALKNVPTKSMALATGAT